MSDLNILLASPEVRLMMRADDVDEGALLAELNAMSVQLRKNARAMFGFDRAVCRLQNMSEMMDRLGLGTRTRAQEDLNRLIFRACQVCSADEVCRDWLSRAPNCIGRAPAFCPNTEYFAHIKRAI